MVKLLGCFMFALILDNVSDATCVFIDFHQECVARAESSEDASAEY